MGLPHISLCPYGEGTVDKLIADWLITHRDRDGSQLTSESVQGESKSYQEEDGLSLTGLAAHRIVLISSSFQGFPDTNVFYDPTLTRLILKSRGSIKEISKLRGKYIA